MRLARWVLLLSLTLAGSSLKTDSSATGLMPMIASGGGASGGGGVTGSCNGLLDASTGCAMPMLMGI
jgi:hypothetical protein